MKITQKCSGNNTPRKCATKRSRSFYVTCWEKPTFDELSMSYMIYGKELCPETGREHWHCWLRFHNAKTIKAGLKYLPEGTWNIDQRGTNEECWAYITKDGDYKEFGNRPSQGQRNDLLKVASDISSGTTVDEITMNDPVLYHQYGRTLNKLEDLRMRNIFRTEMTKGYWYYGSTGTGKSHKAFENYHPSTHYVLINDNGWWDGYTQQEVVIINDFRGWLNYDLLLQLVDKWPMSVKRRGREPIPFISKKIIITSSLSPDEVYHNRAENDKIEQLLRRFEIECLDSDVVIIETP